MEKKREKKKYIYIFKEVKETKIKENKHRFEMRIFLFLKDFLAFFFFLVEFKS